MFFDARRDRARSVSILNERTIHGTHVARRGMDITVGMNVCVYMCIERERKREVRGDFFEALERDLSRFEFFGTAWFEGSEALAGRSFTSI